MAGFMCKFVEAAVRRYRHRIRRWQLTAASNSASVLSLTEDELLGLTYRLAEAARQVDPTLEIVVGVAQPWGEYMAAAERTHSPFVFADTLIRSGMNLAALDVEIVMGPTPRGSYCRDLLETSRILDLYALLGVPLRVTLGYPSARRGGHGLRPGDARQRRPLARRLHAGNAGGLGGRLRDRWRCASPTSRGCNGSTFPTPSRTSSRTAACSTRRARRNRRRQNSAKYGKRISSDSTRLVPAIQRRKANPTIA